MVANPGVSASGSPTGRASSGGFPLMTTRLTLYCWLAMRGRNTAFDCYLPSVRGATLFAAAAQSPDPGDLTLRLTVGDGRTVVADAQEEGTEFGSGPLLGQERGAIMAPLSESARCSRMWESA